MSKTETQDVAVILVSKDENKKINFTHFEPHIIYFQNGHNNGITHKILSYSNNYQVLDSY